MDSRTAEQVFYDAITKYSVVPTDPKIEQYKAYLKAFLNEDIELVADGDTVVTTDPLEEHDDLAMLRYGVYNTVGNITVVVSGGAHNPQERLDHLTELFDCFKGAKFNEPFKTPKGVIMFKPDGNTIDYPIKTFINCGPCSSITLNSITFTKDATVITVGANEDGTQGAGVNQMQTDEPGKLIKMPGVWNTFIQNAKNANANVKNMSVEHTRYVLFPNPKRVSPSSPFYEMTHPKIYQYMLSSTAMFVVSRPPVEYGLRVNEGNSIIDIQLYDAFVKDEHYQRGLNKLNDYMEIGKSKNLAPQYYESAAIPLMCANCMGAEYLPGAFGFGPTDKVAKQTLGCLTRESAAIVFAKIEKLEYFTPAYDPLAYITGIMGI
jgi:hypothetical protein